MVTKRIPGEGPNRVVEVVRSYQDYLSHVEFLKPGSLARARFDALLESNAEGGRAEAVVFALLRTRRLNPRLNENPSSGGVDFICNYGECEFVVEVTSLTREAISESSGLPISFTDGSGGAFHLQAVTAMLRTKASRKAPQLANFPGTRILVIASEHPGAGLLLGTMGAKELMTGGEMICVPVGPEGPTGDDYVGTELREAAFIRIKNGVLEPCRRSISAILLGHIHLDGIDLVGLLHPEPAYQMNVSFFPDVPFAKLQWPIQGSEMHIEWVVGSPTPARGYHFPIKLTEGELRNGIT